MIPSLPWPRAQDEAGFADLLATIRAGTCAAFLGSGLSQNARYLSWKGLLQELSRFVAERSGQAVNEEPDLYEWAEKCRAKLTKEDYIEFFQWQFGPDAARAQTDVTYQDLDQIPFTSIVTTNYDACLLHATRRGLKREWHCYPQLDATLLRAGHIFHIHGIVHPEHPAAYVRWIVFTKSDYLGAYRDDDVLSQFLYQLANNHDLVFIGFSLEDEFLTDQVQRIWATRSRRQVELAAEGWRIPGRTHFALLPELAAERALEYQTDEPDQQEKDDARYQKYGIQVIRYRPLNGVHRGLADVLEVMSRECSPNPVAELSQARDFRYDPEIRT